MHTGILMQIHHAITLEDMQLYLEVLINAIKLFGMIRELSSDVVGPYKDGFQMRPCPLNLKPDDDNRVCSSKLLLPVRDLLQKVPYKL